MMLMHCFDICKSVGESIWEQHTYDIKARSPFLKTIGCMDAVQRFRSKLLHHSSILTGSYQHEPHPCAVNCMHKAHWPSLLNNLFSSRLYSHFHLEIPVCSINTRTQETLLDPIQYAEMSLVSHEERRPLQSSPINTINLFPLWMDQRWPFSPLLVFLFQL